MKHEDSGEKYGVKKVTDVKVVAIQRQRRAFEPRHVITSRRNVGELYAFTPAPMAPDQQASNIS